MLSLNPSFLAELYSCMHMALPPATVGFLLTFGRRGILGGSPPSEPQPVTLLSPPNRCNWTRFLRPSTLLPERCAPPGRTNIAGCVLRRAASHWCVTTFTLFEFTYNMYRVISTPRPPSSPQPGTRESTKGWRIWRSQRLSRGFAIPALLLPSTGEKAH